MKQTAGKIYARRYFYLQYLASLMTPRQLRSSNVLALLGEDFRELELLTELNIEPYRVFSIERDHAIYKRQQAMNRSEDLGVVLYHGELSDFVHTHMRHLGISVFNLDICGSFLRGIDPVLGELLLHVRKKPQTVVATYHSAARDKPQLMEGLKSLVILLWLAPDVIDRLVRHLYGQYRAAGMSENDRSTGEISRNMLLRHLFWLRSHMEHIMIGAYVAGTNDSSNIACAFAEQETVWRKFVSQVAFPLSYGDVIKFVEALPRPTCDALEMDLDFGDVELLTYVANDGFYHNCYFASFEYSGACVSLSTWLVETAKTLRRNKVTLVNATGEVFPSRFGDVAVDTDAAVLWDKAGLVAELRQLVIPPVTAYVPLETIQVQDDCPVEVSTAEQIRRFAREYPAMTAREVIQRLSLQMPVAKVAAYMAVARRK